MKIRMFHFALALAAFLTAGTKAPAQNSNSHYTYFPLSIYFFNDCTGEVVMGGGQMRVASNSIVDQSGGVHITFQFRSDFTAVGLTSGQTYTGHDSTNQTVNFSGFNSQNEVTFSQVNHVNTSGGQNNLFIKESYHITVNANGDITAFTPDEFNFFCR